MDFIVEDGTGIADATSYVTIEFSNDYLGSVWSGSVIREKEQALITASEYADARWGKHF